MDQKRSHTTKREDRGEQKVGLMLGGSGRMEMIGVKGHNRKRSEVLSTYH